MKYFRQASLLLLFASVTFAHDPYEITATASIFSNRIEVRATMEYKAARLLAGLGWPTNEIDHAAEFTAMTPTLAAQAEKFFQLTAASENLPTQKSTVELGGEDHITFALNYQPTTARLLTVSAPGLAALAPEGQYGVSLTVLDMVKSKVLGQHVFDAANPLATAAFGSITNEAITAILQPVATASSSNTVAPRPAPLEDEMTNTKRRLIFCLILGFVGVTQLLRSLKRRAEK